ncbi:hypothetical protein KXS11_10540 [Plantibacter flavus]|uniref:hypothetical protein n=1 Tax=Plantibacter flavus TaxID=150123 RepID=UPI003F183FF6
MSEVDFWGAVVPAWFGGVGGIAAAVVSTIALVKSIRTQGGVETLKGAANTGASNEQLRRSGEGPRITSDGPIVSPVTWTTWQETRNRYRLRNDSTQNGAAARLTGFRDATPGGDEAATYAGPLPVELAPNDTIPFSIEKSLASPSVTAIELTWTDADGTERKRTLYV